MLSFSGNFTIAHRSNKRCTFQVRTSQDSQVEESCMLSSVAYRGSVCYFYWKKGALSDLGIQNSLFPLSPTRCSHFKYQNPD